MKIFIDTNVIIDLIADRKPYSQHAIKIFSAAEKKQISLFVSSHSIITTHYLMKKYMDEKSLRKLILTLLDFTQILSTTSDHIKMGLRSNHPDFEDAIQIFCAASIQNVDCIVTRNLKDYKTSEIPVLSPEEVCLKL